MFLWALLFIALAVINAPFAFSSGEESWIGKLLLVEALIGLAVVGWVAHKRDRRDNAIHDHPVGPVHPG